MKPRRKTAAWLAARRASSTRHMISVDFRALMERENLTVEALAQQLRYSVPGTVQMILRGTVKPRIYEQLSAAFKSIPRRNA